MTLCAGQVVVMRPRLHRMVACAPIGKGHLVEKTKRREQLNRAEGGGAADPWSALLGGGPQPSLQKSLPSVAHSTICSMMALRGRVERKPACSRAATIWGALISGEKVIVVALAYSPQLLTPRISVWYPLAARY